MDDLDELRERIATLELELKTMTGNRDRGMQVNREALAAWAKDRERIATLEGVLDGAIDVFRHHDCPQSHLAPECHLCEILIEADALLGNRDVGAEHSDARLETGVAWRRTERLYHQGLISDEELRVARQQFIEARRE